jgi:non-specific serine/threonine protein kinase/serine/threonine-protein kinase
VIVGHSRPIAGRYQLEEPLGAGGMGTVYAAHDVRLDRPVAVKVLRRELTRDPSLRRRFEREARAAARVSHPHAVAVFDTGEDRDGETFIVMERLSGRTLVDELADGGPLDEARLRRIADEVLGALAAAHDQGIVHRDVKPGNILLADGGSVKIGDFGIATSLDAGETSTAVPLGTPAYTAPERLRGFAATPRSDLFSFAVVLYEAAAGGRPFTGDAAGPVAEAVVAGTHTPLREHRPELSPAFVDGVERALMVDPDDRFASAEEMRAALAARTDVPAMDVVGTEPLPGPPTATATLPSPRRPPAPERSAPRRRVDVARWLVGGALALVLVVVVVLLLTRGGDTPTTPASRPAASTTAVAAGPAPTPRGAPVPAPLARALDRLDQAVRP